MNRLNQILDRLLPRPSKEIHDALGWTLTLLLSLVGLLMFWQDWLGGLSCYAAAIAICPKIETPPWIRVLLVLLSVYVLYHS